MCTRTHTAFDLLYKQYTPYVTRLARRLSWGDRDTAADLEQEAWLALFLTPERRWEEPRYVRTVAFRAMSRWLEREGEAHGVVAAERHPRPRQCGPGRARSNVLHFRRHVPRQQIEPRERLLRRAA